MTSIVPVQVVGVHVDPETGTSAVLLGDPDELTRVLPIMVGPTETQAIVMALAGLAPPRPSTHDLATTLLIAADAHIEQVVVTDLLDGVFFADILLAAATETHSVSARPSDAIALAVRAAAPIFVRESVLTDAAVPIEREPTQPLDDDEIEEIVDRFHEFLADARPSDFEVVDEPGEDDDGGVEP